MTADWWNLPNATNNLTSINGVGDFFLKYPSFILGNYFALGILIIIWVGTFGSSLAMGSRKSLLYASFITFVLSMYLIKYINPIVPIVLIILVIIGAIGSKSEPNY